MTDRPSQPTSEADAEAHRFLSVDHLKSDIVARSVRSGGVTLAAQAIKVLIQGAAIIVLARLLAPADFGLFAMVAAFLTLLELFKDLGLSTATVQRADLTLRQVSTLFWLNSALGVAVAAVLAALAPALAWLYGEPVLIEITPVAALAFLFTGIAAQHLALLRRQMRFVSFAWIQAGAELIALAVAVAVAWLGLGVWALVLQRIVWSVALAAGAWSACGWRPGRPGSLAEVRSFVVFGGNATLSMTITHLAGSLDKILIGWHWGAAPLGLYERAQRLQLLPTQNLTLPLGNVAIAGLSRLRHEPARYRHMYLAAVVRIGMVIAPLGGLFVAGADPLIVLLLGGQWGGIVPVIQWMAAAMVYMPVTYALGWLYLSQDRTPEMLQAGIANAVLTAAAIVAGLPWGPVGVAASLVVSGAAIRMPLLFWLAGRRGPVRIRDLWHAILMPCTAAVAVVGAVTFAQIWAGIEYLPPAAAAAVICALAIAISLLIYALFAEGRHALMSAIRLPRTMLANEDAKSAAS